MLDLFRRGEILPEGQSKEEETKLIRRAMGKEPLKRDADREKAGDRWLEEFSNSRD